MMTDAERNEIIQAVLVQIQSDSHSVDELETAASLDGVHSLPAVSGDQLVNVPIAMLRKPAEDAAAAAETATKKATDAATAASESKASADTAAETANKAAAAALLAATADVYLTQADYEALQKPDRNKTYFVYEEEEGQS